MFWLTVWAYDLLGQENMAKHVALTVAFGTIKLLISWSLQSESKDVCWFSTHFLHFIPYGPGQQDDAPLLFS